MEKGIEKTKVYNVIIMDRSGSMWDIQKPAIMGFNEVLGGVKAAKKRFADTQEQYVSLVIFDSSSIDELYWNADPDGAAILTDETYVPCAATPLYDAMGRTLTRLEKELRGDTNHAVVVTIITDGYENDSREYSLASVQALVRHLKKEGWSFAYMGTDHDVESVTLSLSITNVVKFEKTEEGTMQSFKKERRARERYMERVEEFNLAEPCASPEQRVILSTCLADGYYEEDPQLNQAYADRITPVKVKGLRKDDVLVFGSDAEGKHSGGMALQAVRKFGAQKGVPEGPQGQCYAIPTTGDAVGPHEIANAFARMVEYAKAHPEKTFLVTALGCGHGGYEPEFISHYLEAGIKVENIHYPLVFWQEFEKRGLVDEVYFD